MRKLFIAIMTIAAIALAGCKDKNDEPEMGGGEHFDCSLPANVEAVDLGLPSGIKWANMNVGATKPEEYGAYFAWGETSPKSEYTESNYTYADLYPFVLPASNDAAAKNWGGKWRMPTPEELDELRGNCTWTWTDNYNNIGVAGYIVSSNVVGNTNSIFLPAAGHCRGNGIFDVGLVGYLWSSSYSGSYKARHIFFHSNEVNWNGISRFYGLTVRAVSTYENKN